jgi:hypothetical protein
MFRWLLVVVCIPLEAVWDLFGPYDAEFDRAIAAQAAELQRLADNNL